MLSENQVTELNSFIEEKGYCKIENSIHPQLLNFITLSSNIDLVTSELETHTQSVVGESTPHSKYNSITGETLLVHFTDLYSKITGKNLIPTYSYLRKYYKGNILPPHKDRPACQYSATLQVDKIKDSNWGFYLYDNLNEVQFIESNIGDIIFYKGEDNLHWRNPLIHEWSTHIFLHWVDKDNPIYNSYHYDGRKSLGLPK